jgi:acyl dehydratase
MTPLEDSVGRPVLDRIDPHVLEASVDTIRLFARAYGDDNPLYSDAEYARAGPRRRLVAPPLFPLATGAPAPDGDQEPVDLEAFGVGAGQTIRGDRWLLRRPVVEGARLVRSKHIYRVDAAPESGADGEVCTVTVRTTYRWRGDVYAVNDRIREYRPGRTRPGGDGRRRATYRPEELAELDRAHASAGRRGAEVRFLEDVSAGAPMGTLVKGPMTVTDLVSYRGGVGPGPLGGEPMRMAYLNRLARPHLYTPDASGAPDIVERRHYDDAYARSLGLAGADDYSHTRLTWLTQLIGDWMGDAGWLWSLSGSTTLAHNYVGDTHWLEGEVSAVRDAEGFGVVDVVVRCRNQLHQVTSTADATVLLPRRGESHVTDHHLDLHAGSAEAMW